jgi:hypothetical protein
MVAEAANTTISLLRGETVDEYGDVIDSNTPVFTGVPAVLVEQPGQTQDPSNPTPRTIRAIKLVVPSFLGLLDTDRILDEPTGNTYIVITVTTPPTLMGAPVDTVARLKRVTANTT